MIVPTLCVGMHPVTLCVTQADAERPKRHSHAERANDQPLRDNTLEHSTEYLLS